MYELQLKLIYFVTKIRGVTQLLKKMTYQKLELIVMQNPTCTYVCFNLIQFNAMPSPFKAFLLVHVLTHVRFCVDYQSKIDQCQSLHTKIETR